MANRLDLLIRVVKLLEQALSSDEDGCKNRVSEALALVYEAIND